MTAKSKGSRIPTAPRPDNGRRWKKVAVRLDLLAGLLKTRHNPMRFHTICKGMPEDGIVAHARIEFRYVTRARGVSPMEVADKVILYIESAEFAPLRYDEEVPELSPTFEVIQGVRDAEGV